MISDVEPQHRQHPEQSAEQQPVFSRQRLAESARYALLRRLSPALRHNMAGALQPLNMMSILLEKRLQNPQPDLAAVVKNSRQLSQASVEASTSCMDVVTWLTPSTSDFVSVARAIEDATQLVATELSFKGLTIVNNTADLPVELSRSLTRNVFMAALMALTDAALSPAQVVVQARLDAGTLVLTIALESAPEAACDLLSPGSGDLPYRQLEWADVQVLAEAESVQLTHTTGRVELGFASQLLRLG